MVLNGFLAVFGVAVLGGLTLELYKWWQLRESEAFPVYAKKPKYWVITALMVLAGGGLAALYGTDDVEAILAFNIGLSSPAIIRALSRRTPHGEGEGERPDPDGNDERNVRWDGGRQQRAVEPSVQAFLSQ